MATRFVQLSCSSLIARPLLMVLALLFACLSPAQITPAPEPASSASSVTLSELSDPSDPTAGDAILRQARRDLLGKHLEQAHAAVDSYNAAHPGSAQGLYLLGEILLRQNRAAESLHTFTEAAAKQPPSGDQLRLVALDYVLLKDNPRAVSWLERSIQLAPADAESWYALGRVRYSTGDFHGAEQDFIQSLVLAPGSAKTEDNLGLCYVAQGDLQRAASAYERALVAQQTSDRTNEQPLLDYGTLLIQLGEMARAEKLLADSVSIAPACAGCRETLGRALLAMGEASAAIEQMQAAIRLEPQNPRFHYLLGRIYKQTGDQALAKTEFAQSARLYGTHSTPLR